MDIGVSIGNTGTFLSGEIFVNNVEIFDQERRKSARVVVFQCRRSG